MKEKIKEKRYNSNLEPVTSRLQDQRFIHRAKNLLCILCE